MCKARAGFEGPVSRRVGAHAIAALTARDGAPRAWNDVSSVTATTCPNCPNPVKATNIQATVCISTPFVRSVDQGWDGTKRMPTHGVRMSHTAHLGVAGDDVHVQTRGVRVNGAPLTEFSHRRAPGPVAEHPPTP